MKGHLEKLQQIIIPFLKERGVAKAGLFGSYVRGDQHDNSDIDILIEFKKGISLLEFVKIKLDLEDVLNKKVDLVEYHAIKPRLKNKILSEEIRIYG